MTTGNRCEARLVPSVHHWWTWLYPDSRQSQRLQAASVRPRVSVGSLIIPIIACPGCWTSPTPSSPSRLGQSAVVSTLRAEAWSSFGRHRPLLQGSPQPETDCPQACARKPGDCLVEPNRLSGILSYVTQASHASQPYTLEGRGVPLRGMQRACVRREPVQLERTEKG